MTPPSWGIPVILVVGILIVAFGWWWDHRRHRLAADGFTTEEELAGALPPPTLPDADLAALLAGRGDAATLPAGLADPAFLTHRARGVAAVRDALVLVTDAALDDERLVIPLLAAARTAQRPLVLVASGFSFPLLGTLRANAVSGHVVTLPVELADPELLAKAAWMCGGEVVPAADLVSGWLPDRAWGAASAWIADPEDSWVNGVSRGQASGVSQN